MRHDKTAVTTAPAKERKEAFMKGGVAVKRSRHATDLIFVLSLFCLFTVLSLFVVIQGADVYQGISREMSANYSARGTVAYLTEKVRQNDRENGVAVKEIGGEPALVFSEEIGGEVYETGRICTAAAAGDYCEAGDGNRTGKRTADYGAEGAAAGAS